MRVYYDRDCDVNLIRKESSHFGIWISRACSCFEFKRQWSQNLVVALGGSPSAKSTR